MHTHLREPGFEYKETIASGSEAAVAGGFTSVACMPNTNPVNDNRSVTEFIRRKAAECGLANVYPIAAISLKSEGAALTEFWDLKDAGAVGFSDDGKPVMNAALMRRALEYASSLDMPIIVHCEDRNLSAGGVMHEGFVSTEIGLPGIPAIAEDVMVARDLLLAEFTGAPLHIAHVSTAGAVRLIREAKARGVRVTAETAPHYFTLTDEAVRTFDTNAKVYPPLRGAEDVAAIREGLRDGTIDVIASDHAPHARTDKEVEFDYAASGLTGLETSLALSLASGRRRDSDAFGPDRKDDPPARRDPPHPEGDPRRRRRRRYHRHRPGAGMDRRSRALPFPREEHPLSRLDPEGKGGPDDRRRRRSAIAIAEMTDARHAFNTGPRPLSCGSSITANRTGS